MKIYRKKLNENVLEKIEWKCYSKKLNENFIVIN